MPRIKLTLEYDGTDFVGWQIQPNGRSVQQTLEDSLSRLLDTPITVRGAARTDSGVHALAQVAVFDTDRTLPLKAYAVGLSNMLPADLAVVRAEEVAPDFDPRRLSSGKRYRYLISNLTYAAPTRRRTHWQIFQPLDYDAMVRAAPVLLGRHDFSAFRAADCQAKHAVRELRRVEWERGESGELVLWVEGTAFLKHMVRNLAGSLVAMGRGKQRVEWLREVLATKDRTLAGMTAPAHGLTLMDVFFDPRPARAEDAVDDE
ncbi:MAG: tRNA pseudouridine(38-40) synthase TruA [Myxococcaceae bacterium]